VVKTRLDRTNFQFFATAPPSVHGLLFEVVALELLLNWSQTTRFAISQLLHPGIKDHPPVPSAFKSRIHQGEFKFSTPTLVEFMNESDVVGAVKSALASHEVVLALPRSPYFAGFDGIYAWNESGVNYAFLLQDRGGQVLHNFWKDFTCCIGYVVDGERYGTFPPQAPDSKCVSKRDFFNLSSACSHTRGRNLLKKQLKEHQKSPNIEQPRIVTWRLQRH